MFTFSFGSAFAMTDFNGKAYAAMQKGDYDTSAPKVTSGVQGGSGITDAERDDYVATLEKALKGLNDNATYDLAEYCGNHLANVTNYVKDALEAAKVTTTSAALNQIKTDLADKVKTAKKKADLIKALEDGNGQYDTANADASYKFTLRLAAGTYLLPGYGYFTTDADNVEIIKEDGSNHLTQTPALKWMLDNGYETKAQIETTAAQAAFEKAVVKVTGKADGNTVYTAQVADFTPEFVAAYYEWQGYVAKLAQTAITDLEATIAVEKEMKTFEKTVLTAPF